MVDAYSKKTWTQLMNTDTTAGKTLAVLYGWFCSETGILTTLVSDNGPQFTAEEFKDKMKKWGIKHIFSPPYHPASNGAAERAVQLYKDRLKKMDISSKLVELHVALAYIGKVHGLTPHSSTGRCPYELIKQGGLPSMFPSLTSDVKKQEELATVRDTTARMRNRRDFTEGENVMVYDVHTKLSYPAEVLEVLGVNNYLVASDNGQKHVSGDVMSRTSITNTLEDKEDDPSQQDVSDSQEDDTLSVMSDMSDDLEVIIDDIDEVPPALEVEDDFEPPPRRVSRELANLGNSSQHLPRLRSGKTYACKCTI